MTGTKDGAFKAREANLKRDPDFYKKIGAKGGEKGTSGGFASDKVGADGLTGRERARKVGAWGGTKSRKKPGGLKGFELHYEAGDE